MRRLSVGMIWFLALIAMAYSPGGAMAQSYAYEKWRLPWGDWTIGQLQTVTTGYGGSSEHQGINLYALDFATGYYPTLNWPVASTAEGTVTLGSNPTAGTFVDINHVDGSGVSHYAHLNTAFFGTGTHVEQGQLIGLAGITGVTNGNIHLHFRISKNGNAVIPEPMSGHTGFSVNGQYHESDNVMPGDGFYTWPGGWPAFYQPIRDAFDRAVPDSGAQFQKGWIKKGSTWDPCGGNGTGHCQWVHRWGPGWVQDLKGPEPGQSNYHGHGTGRGAMMWLDGTSNAWWVHGVIWDQYIGLGGGEYGSTLGYPIEDERFWFYYFGVPLYRQRFQAGCIWFNTNDLGTNWDYYYAGSPCSS